MSDLVQRLGDFYTEVDGESDEAEENEVDRRPFTRPFAKHAGNADELEIYSSKGKKKELQPWEGPLLLQMYCCCSFPFSEPKPVLTCLFITR